MHVGVVMTSSSLATILLSLLLGLIFLGLLSLTFTEGYQPLFPTTTLANVTGTPESADRIGGAWTSVEQNTGNEEADFKAHYERVEKSIRCKEPQPRLLYPEDLLYPGQKLLATGVFYRPRATWAHRCQHDAGCCRHSDDVCQPSSRQNVEVVFKVIVVQDTPQLDPIVNYVRVHFDNHTACSCVPRNDVPRRRRRRRGRRRR